MLFSIPCIDCLSVASAAHHAVQCTSTTTQPPSPVVTTSQDVESLADRIRKFFSGWVGILTVCVVVAVISGMALLIWCDVRRRRRQKAERKSTRQLLHQLRSETRHEEKSHGSVEDFAFPDFGNASDGLAFGSPAGGVMAVIRNGLSRSNSQSSSRSSQDEEDGDFAAMDFFKEMVAREISSDDSSGSDGEGSSTSPSPSPNSSPHRPLSATRPGSQISRTSLRNQPIIEEDEDGSTTLID